MKKLFKLLLVVLLAFSFVGCKGKEKEVDPYADYDKFTIEDLTFYVPKSQNAKKMDVDGYEYAVGNDDLVVFVQHVAIEDAKAQGYDIEAVKKSVFEGYTVEKVGNWETIKYDNTVDGVEYHYTYSWLQSDTNIWDFNIICFKEDEAKFAPIMDDIITKATLGK